MNARTAACAALLAVAALTTGCSSSGGSTDKPSTPAATVTKTVDQVAARKACVDAWADALQQDADAGIDQAPAACDGLPADDKLDRYMEGLQQRNQANRDDAKACIEDPTCTALPVP